MNKLEDARHILELMPRSMSHLGAWPTWQWMLGRAQKTLHVSRPKLLNVRPRFLLHPVALRARTSDPWVFQQIMVEDEYLPLKDLSLSTILDLGANIGLSSAWFLSHFPEASTFAVEAEADNYATCCQNLAAYGDRARVLHGAAWSRRTTLSLQRRKYDTENSVQEAGREAADTQVEGWDLASLIDLTGFPHIDLLKIDVEGAEAEIFRAEVSTWLPKVRNLCVELHGQECRDAFFRALTGYDFDHRVSGELDFCINLRPASQGRPAPIPPQAPGSRDRPSHLAPRALA